MAFQGWWSEPPFPLKHQLNDEIKIVPDSCGHLCAANYMNLTVSDQSLIQLSHKEVTRYLKRELKTSILDDLSPYLWLIAKQSSSHIDALHRQLIKGRAIKVIEDLKLHLVWFYNAIYVKPIPQCLFNYAFWKIFLYRSAISNEGLPSSGRVATSTVPSYLLKAALGYLRTYAYLIQHPSDFHLAKEYHLLPKHMEWNSFSRFVAPFQNLDDDLVSPWYHFGQFRLTRLNYAVRIFRPQSSLSSWYYHEIYWNTQAYIERYFAPLLFVFGSTSVILAAMQVAFALPEEIVGAIKYWVAFGRASWMFSVVMIVFVFALWLLMLGGIVGFIAGQLAFAVKRRA